MPKITLSQTYVFQGKHYGPGEVEIENETAAKELAARDKAVLEAKAGTTTTVDTTGGTVAEPEAPAAPRRATAPKDGSTTKPKA